MYPVGRTTKSDSFPTGCMADTQATPYGQQGGPGAGESNSQHRGSRLFRTKMHPTIIEWIVIVEWLTTRGHNVIKVHGKFTEAVAQKYAKRLRDTAKYTPEDIELPPSAVKLLTCTARPIERPERGIL